MESLLGLLGYGGCLAFMCFAFIRPDLFIKLEEIKSRHENLPARDDSDDGDQLEEERLASLREIVDARSKSKPVRKKSEQSATKLNHLFVGATAIIYPITAYGAFDNLQSLAPVAALLLLVPFAVATYVSYFVGRFKGIIGGMREASICALLVGCAINFFYTIGLGDVFGLFLLPFTFLCLVLGIFFGHLTGGLLNPSFSH